MESNKYYFKFSLDNEDDLIDPYYSKKIEHLVIKKNKFDTKKRPLIATNRKILELITTIKTLISNGGHNINDEEVSKYVIGIDEQLKKYDANLTPFCQYFMVHNITFSLYSKLKQNEKIKVLNYLIQQYISNRDDMYSYNGYTDTVLQVLSDSYSHKRKSSYGVYKIGNVLNKMGIHNFLKINGANINTNMYFLLTDKDGKKTFNELNKIFNISLKEKKNRKTKKYPDALIKIGNHYFLVEHKQMKESGGDQDKTIETAINFVSKKPELKLGVLHYVSYIDGPYLNQSLNRKSSKTAKNKMIKSDIISVLSKNNRSNYLVNSNGFNKLISDYLKDYKEKNKN